MTEERVTDPDTGGQKGRKDIELGFLDPYALEELGRVASMGSRKYDPFNYLKGYSWMLSVNAMFRHTMAFLKGEDRDKESGCLHMAHAAWHALTLVSFAIRKIGTDDRAPKIGPPEATDLCANGDHYFITMTIYGDPVYQRCSDCGEERSLDDRS